MQVAYREDYLKLTPRKAFLGIAITEASLYSQPENSWNRTATATSPIFLWGVPEEATQKDPESKAARG